MRLSLLPLLLLSWLLSFCSMGYELLIVRILTSHTSDAVLSQSLTIGLFLLALGVGAWLFSFVPAGRRISVLVNAEILLSFIAVVAAPSIALMSIYLRTTLRFVIGAQIFTLAIGLLSGLELPALMDAGRKLSSRGVGLVLAANYVGALCASIALPLIFFPSMGPYRTAAVLALFSALAAGGLILVFRLLTLHVRILFLLLAVLLPTFLASRWDSFEQFYLKSFYYAAPSSLVSFKTVLQTHRSLPPVQRLSTPYQDIDVVADNLEMFGGERSGGFHLFIDQRNQFGSRTSRIYHDTMVHGGFNLIGHVPARVLVIGGGDGLIARELLRRPEVKSITQVELDPAMIGLANDFRPLRALNEGSLLDPRVHVEIADGFSWLRTEPAKFDAVLIDLPHPVSVDLARLYSVEFYRFVSSHLSDDGFMIFDFPFDALSKSPDPRNLPAARSVLRAVTAAGFANYTGFGTWESFLIASKRPNPLEFNYPALAPWIPLQSAFNLVRIHLPDITAADHANSIFRPVILHIHLDGTG